MSCPLPRPRLAALLIAATVAALALDVGAAATRSRAARAEFHRSTPCPATGKSRGACPGYVVDHIVPLCAGGADSPDNMQWQTVHEAKLKDRDELALCRAASQPTR